MYDAAPLVRKRTFPKLFTSVLVGCMLCFPILESVAQLDSGSVNGGRYNAEPSEKPDKIPVHLYFADRNHTFLKSELRVMNRPDDPVALGKAIVEALIEGPQKGLVRTIPAGTGLSAIYIDSGNVCYIDLSAAVKAKHPGGSNSEMLTIYSVVNSLILNVSEIKQVKVLIDGNEAPTLAGHISLQYPFWAHMLLIR